jgi:hypothetical protein
MEYLSFLVIGVSEFFTLIFYVAILFLIIGVIRGALAEGQITHSNWLQYIEGHPFSTQQFYTALEREIKELDIPNVFISRVGYPQGGLFSQSRVYLRIRCKEYIFDVCAAPFSTGTFVSWWMGEIPDLLRNMLMKIPVLGVFFRKRQKTFFELDNEALFKERFSATVKKVFNELSTQEGTRIISEATPL